MQPLRKSAPWSPNFFDEDVSCTAPATENASLQILLETATKPTRLAKFCNGAEFIVPATRNDAWTSKSAPEAFCAFSLRHVLRATTAYTFSTSEPQVARTCGVLCILTSNCASRHNAVHFSTSQLPKVARRMWCFYHFDFETRRVFLTSQLAK